MKPPASSAGFSLIEIMVATLILGFALVGLTHGVTTALQSNKDSELLAGASLFAAGQMELLRSDPLISPGVTEGQGVGAASLYTWTQTVAKTDLDGLYDVEVLVSHASTGDSLYSLKTMIFDPPALKKETGQESDRKKRRGADGGRRRGS